MARRWLSKSPGWSQSRQLSLPSPNSVPSAGHPASCDTHRDGVEGPWRSSQVPAERQEPFWKSPRDPYPKKSSTATPFPQTPPAMEMGLPGLLPVGRASPSLPCPHPTSTCAQSSATLPIHGLLYRFGGPWISPQHFSGPQRPQTQICPKPRSAGHRTHPAFPLREAPSHTRASKPTSTSHRQHCGTAPPVWHPLPR